MVTSHVRLGGWSVLVTHNIISIKAFEMAPIPKDILGYTLSEHQHKVLLLKID